MAVPSNPVRIYTSGNLGAQQLAGGALDMINIFKQVAKGQFTNLQSISVTLSGTKAVITCSEKHKLYPYQVIKLTNTGTALEGQEFFVLNDENHTDIKFAVELGAAATALPAAITIILPPLNWDVVEDSVDWFSMRPSVEKRTPLLRMSKTRNNPTANAYRRYSTYLARDVNGDGSVVKNYTAECFLVPAPWLFNSAFDEPKAWMIIADDKFMYFLPNIPAGAYGGDANYSFLNNGGNKERLFNSPTLVYQYGIPSVFLEDLLPEYCTIYNALNVNEEARAREGRVHDAEDFHNGYINLTGSWCWGTARIPFSFAGASGQATTVFNMGSGVTGGDFPTLGAYGMPVMKVPLRLNSGVFGVARGLRSFMANVVTMIYNSDRVFITNKEVNIPKNALNLGLMELNTTAGKNAVVLSLCSHTYRRVAGYQANIFNAGMCGIRVGCSWETEDLEGL